MSALEIKFNSSEITLFPQVDSIFNNISGTSMMGLRPIPRMQVMSLQNPENILLLSL